MKHSLLLIALLLLLPGPLFAAENPSDSSRVAEIQKTYATELQVLQTYAGNPCDYDHVDAVMATAEKLFAKVNFVGLSRQSLESLLGEPPPQGTGQDHAITYMYCKDGGGVIRTFQLDSHDIVTSVKVVPAN